MKTFYYSEKGLMNVHGCVVAKDKEQALELINNELQRLGVVPNIKIWHLQYCRNGEVLINKQQT